MNQKTSDELQVLVMSNRDVRMLASGAWILADIIDQGVQDMIRAGRPLETISDMAANGEYVRRLAERMDTETAA